MATSGASPSPTTGGVQETLDFSSLPEDQRPVLECIGVSAEDVAVFNAESRPPASLEASYGWRLSVGMGNTPGEEWFLFQPSGYEVIGAPVLDSYVYGTGYVAFLTNHWSVERPGGSWHWLQSTASPREGIRDNWDNVEWSDERKSAVKQAIVWMSTHCSVG